MSKSNFDAREWTRCRVFMLLHDAPDTQVLSLHESELSLDIVVFHVAFLVICYVF
jgi:hypothetical protein